MLPIKDDAPRYSTPYINYLLISLNAVVFIFELLLAPDDRNSFVFHFGVVPAAFPAAFHLGGAVSVTAAFVPIVSSMFLHATWLHLIFNMWALWIFGDNVEDYLGHFRYGAFYIGTGIIAALVHIAFNWGSAVPTVGASGAIAGVMGAYFLLYPAARVLTWFFIFVAWLPAWVILGYWFVVQFLSGAATSMAYSNRSTGGIAFWAHVGGFIAGVTLIKLLPKRPQRFSYE
jgi:membrane associated rhomboid family serine protease